MAAQLSILGVYTLRYRYASYSRVDESCMMINTKESVFIRLNEEGVVCSYVVEDVVSKQDKAGTPCLERVNYLIE
jgi:hypothetical protein